MAANPTKRAVDDTNPAVATSVHDSAAGIDSTEPEQVPVNDSEVLVKHVAEETSILSETNKNSVDTHQDESFQARGSSQQGPLESGSTAKAAESITPEPSSSKKNLDERNVVSESDKEAAMMEEESPTSTELAADKNTANQSCESSSENHSPTVLPRFKEPSTCMWTATYAANAPSEDRSSSLVNVLLKPWNTTDTASLVRLSLWSVIDGHGGGCVATYASEVLLPHIAANISKSLECDIVDGGECRVNGQLRDANAIDFEGLLESPTGGQSNPNSIHYRTPLEDDYNDSEHDVESISMDVGVGEEACDDDQSVESRHSCSPPFPFYSPSSPSSSTDESVASVESRRLASGPVGTHSTDEVARVTDAVTDSFCAVDEGWINSIDSVASRQTCCETNGAWNAGACALVVFTIQRLEWTSDVGTNKQDSSESRDDLDSERTNEKEDTEMSNTAHICNPEDSRIRIPGGCECHFYQLQDAMLYTGHVGDCRAVLLGDAPLPDNDIDEVVDSAEESDSDESSYHSYDVTEVLSTSDADDDSSDDEQEDGFGFLENSEIPARMRFMTRPARRLRSATRNSYHHEPFVPLPPLSNHQKEVSSESEDDLQPARKVPRKNHESFSQGNGHVEKPVSPALHLSPLPSTLIAFDLTTDHTPYNETEADAVLRRSNNAPKAISSSIGGGIPRVAGSLAVTRAFGDAYLKTPLLSFFPYKRYAPFITAAPEVSCHLLPLGGDPTITTNVLVLASDGVYDVADGDDILRWIKNFSEERIAAVERECKHGTTDRSLSPESFPDENAPKKRKLRPRRQASTKRRSSLSHLNPASLVVRRVLNKVRRSKRMSMQDLLALPKGRSRRVKHDDITATVVHLGAFVTN